MLEIVLAHSQIRASPETSTMGNRLAEDFPCWKADNDKFDRQIARVIQAIRIESSPDTNGR